MTLASEYGKASSGEPSGERVAVGGEALVCSHCGGSRFFEGEALLNTPGMTFLGLDWANRKARVFECGTCGHLEWFAS